MPELLLERDRRLALRAQAHHLQPLVRVGAQGDTPAVRRELERALDAHGLVKVHYASDDREERTAFYEQAADELSCARIQQIGKMLVFWREPKEKEEPARKAPVLPKKKAAAASRRPGDKKPPKKKDAKPVTRARKKPSRTTKKGALS